MSSTYWSLLKTFTKEFAATFTALICYSRIGNDNMLYSGGINVGMILIVFGFPFLNPYFTSFMRFGPLWESDDRLSNMLEWLFSIVAQITGACFAGYIRKCLTDAFTTESLSGNYVFNPLPDTTNNGVWLSDEMFAVLFLLIGILHLMRSLAEPFLANSVFSVHTPGAADSRAPMPIGLIMSVVLLVIAITHAFPSANQSLHVTMYLLVLDFQTGEVCGFRVLGGILGTAVALLYYHGYYNCEAMYKLPDPPTAPVATRPGQLGTGASSQMKIPFFNHRL